MPLADIHIIRNVSTPDGKQPSGEKVTDAKVAVEGETRRGVTWVKIHDTYNQHSRHLHSQSQRDPIRHLVQPGRCL